MLLTENVFVKAQKRYPPPHQKQVLGAYFPESLARLIGQGYSAVESQSVKSGKCDYFLKCIKQEKRKDHRVY